MYAYDAAIAHILRADVTLLDSSAPIGLSGGLLPALDPPPPEDEPRYCSCQQPSYGDMICCDSDEVGALLY